MQQPNSNDGGLFALNFLIYVITGKWGSITRSSFRILDADECIIEREMLREPEDGSIVHR